MSDRTERRSMTLRDVAIASGIDRRTLTNQVKEGRFPNAFRETSEQGVVRGPWFIPLDDLVAAGITLNGSPRAPEVMLTSEALRAELETVRAELAEERSRRRVAEAIADERATTIEHLREALKTMESLAAATPAPADVPEPVIEEEPRRHRLRGQWLR